MVTRGEGEGEDVMTTDGHITSHKQSVPMDWSKDTLKEDKPPKENNFSTKDKMLGSKCIHYLEVPLLCRAGGSDN